MSDATAKEMAQANAVGGVAFAVLIGAPLVIFGALVTAASVFALPSAGLFALVGVSVGLAFVFGGAFAVGKGYSQYQRGEL